MLPATTSTSTTSWMRLYAQVAPVCGTTGTYNIGTGQQTTVTEVHRLISAVLDRSSPPCYIAAHTGELHAIALDATKAEKELGWKATVDLAEGIQRTIRWLRATLEPELEPEPAALIDA